MQTQKKIETPSEKKFESLEKEFEAAKAKVIPVAKTKMINLRLISSCGCGGSSDVDNIHIEVPEDYNKYSELETIDIEDICEIREDDIEIYEHHFYGNPEEDIDRTEW